jgi:hypothetical protein
MNVVSNQTTGELFQASGKVRLTEHFSQHPVWTSLMKAGETAT